MRCDEIPRANGCLYPLFRSLEVEFFKDLVKILIVGYCRKLLSIHLSIVAKFA